MILPLTGNAGANLSTRRRAAGGRHSGCRSDSGAGCRGDSDSEAATVHPASHHLLVLGSTLPKPQQYMPWACRRLRPIPIRHNFNASPMLRGTARRHAQGSGQCYY